MALLAAVSGEKVVDVLVWIVVAALIYGLLHYLLDWLQLKEPFNRVARVILVVFAVLFLINVLLTLVDKPLVKF